MDITSIAERQGNTRVREGAMVFEIYAARVSVAYVQIAQCEGPPVFLTMNGARCA